MQILKTKPMRLISSFQNAVFHNYANFSGRMSRREFWWYTAALVLLGAATESLWTLAIELSAPDWLCYVALGVQILVFAGLVIPNVAAQVRRLHDLNRPGWLWLLAFIPYVGVIALYVMFLFPANPAGERFGPYDDA